MSTFFVNPTNLYIRTIKDIINLTLKHSPVLTSTISLLCTAIPHIAIVTLRSKAAWSVVACAFAAKKLHTFYSNPDLPQTSLLRQTVLRLKTAAISWCREKRTQTLRSAFQELRIFSPVHPPNNDNPHALEAASRRACETGIHTFIKAQGFQPFVLSPHVREDSCLGIRDYHFPCDLKVAPKHDVFSHTSHVFTMTDVDYYVDINWWLDGRPIMLYTFAPQSVTGSAGNGHWTTAENDNIVYHTKGGGIYTHQLWDYNRDMVYIHKWWGAVLYHVDLRRVNETHAVVLLESVAVVKGPAAWLMPNNPLTRRKFTSNGIGYCSIEDVTYLNRHGEICSHSIPTTSFHTIQQAHSSNPKLEVRDIERLLPTSTDANTAVTRYGSAVRLSALLKANEDNTSVPQVLFIDTIYPFLGDVFKPTVHPVCDPVAGPTYAAGSNINAQYASIAGRVTSQVNTTAFTPFSMQCASEFLDFLVPNEIAHTGVPVTFDVVAEHLNKPNQRAQSERAKHAFGFWTFAVSAFNKGEPYPKLTDPRNISTVPTDHKEELSSFTYSFKENVLKETPWYAFGLNPSQVQDAVSRVCQQFGDIDEGDYSRFDGTNGPIQAWISMHMMLRYFSPEYHPTIRKLCKKEIKAKGFTKDGVSYNTGYSTISGGPQTSDRNTANNAYVSYLAHRMSGKPPIEAWNALGLYGGDDSLNDGSIATYLVKAARNTGLTLKSNPRTPADRTVLFLGRVFYEPWTRRCSMIDLKRQLVKLHVTATSPAKASPELVLKRKATSYAVTDPRTPVLRNWVDLVFKQLGRDLSDKEKIMTVADESWWSKHAVAFPQEATEQDLLDCAAINLGCSIDQVTTYAKLMDNCSDVFKPPFLFYETQSEGFSFSHAAFPYLYPTVPKDQPIWDLVKEQGSAPKSKPKAAEKPINLKDEESEDEQERSEQAPNKKPVPSLKTASHINSTTTKPKHISINSTMPEHLVQQLTNPHFNPHHNKPGLLPTPTTTQLEDKKSTAPAASSIVKSSSNPTHTSSSNNASKTTSKPKKEIVSTSPTKASTITTNGSATPSSSPTPGSTKPKAKSQSRRHHKQVHKRLCARVSKPIHGSASVRS